jgi:putative two-component system response regulator
MKMMATLGRPDCGREGQSDAVTDRKARIAFVDDEPSILELLRRMVGVSRSDWDVESFSDSEQAWVSLRKGRADVIVTDVSMPGLSGQELLRLLRDNESTRDTPVIVLTGLDERSLKREVLDLGATDLLNKPVDASNLLARLRSALRLKRCQDELKVQNETLERKVVERTRQLRASRVEIIWRLACAAEIHDEETGCHVLRVAHSCRIIAEALRQPREFVEMLFLSAPLHDLGKIGIPDAILHKPGRLTEEERQIVHTHCQIGERILSARVPSLGFMHFNLRTFDFAAAAEEDPMLSMAREIAGAHHERWDGGGYPRGLAGENIPLPARITAVADVYDALTSEREYKRALPAVEAVEWIRREAGKQFDPAVCAAFIRSWNAIEEIRTQLTEGR